MVPNEPVGTPDADEFVNTNLGVRSDAAGAMALMNTVATEQRLCSKLVQEPALQLTFTVVVVMLRVQKDTSQPQS